MEQAFIAAATVIAPQYGCIPLINMHDGLILRGGDHASFEDSLKVIEAEAKRISGFKYARLLEKKL
jgi:hypothetical protein